MHEGFGIVTPQRWQSLITHVEEKVEDHYWEADGLIEELLEQFIINNNSDDNISDGGEDGNENVGSMEESDAESAEDVCSITFCLSFISYLYRSKFALEYHSAIRWCYLGTY